MKIHYKIINTVWIVALIALAITPVSSQQAAEGENMPQVSVNQVGFFTDGQKRAALVGTEGESVSWQLLNHSSGEVVAEGITSEGTDDEASGDIVQVADFSEFSTPGTYRILINGVESVPFAIQNDIYSALKTDAARYFYLNRSGIPLEEQYAGEWARPAGHITDYEITCFKGTAANGSEWEGCPYTLDGSGGWYDAGDYGKYVVNGGISLWTLLNFYERYPDSFGDNTLNIPESGNGIPDILDEARWEMEFLLRMQVPEGDAHVGMSFHKLHDRNWSGVPFMPPREYNNDNSHEDPNSGRYVYQPTTAATLNLAATAAQCARIWRDLDPEFAQRCLTAAETAWTAAHQFPDLFAGSVPGAGGGDYGDGYVQDEFFWAAAELLITTDKDEYHTYLIQEASSFLSSRFNGGIISISWNAVAPLGTISLLTVPSNFPEGLIEQLREQIINGANFNLALIQQGAYHIPLPPNGYYWGSNSSVLNNAIVMALAYDLTDDEKYLHGITASMDYLLGMNPLQFSYITGYGTNYAQHPHHRFWGNQPQDGFPAPPPGVVVGGPLEDPAEDTTRNNAIMNSGVAKRYVDMIEAYSSNEVTINWNAPLVWVSAYLDLKRNITR